MGRGKILVIGSATTDVLIPVSHIPVRSEDINVYEQHLSLGGCAFNVCDSIRHFGVPCIPFLPVGGGVYGDFVRSEFKKRGIRTWAPDTSGDNGCCYCFVEPDGERTFICYHGAEYFFRPEWFREIEDSGLGREIDSVYICGLEIEESTGIHIIEFLERHPEYLVYFAPSSRICMIDHGKMDRVLDLSPVLHLNLEEARAYTGCGREEEAALTLFERTRNTVLVTLGADGCRVIGRKDDGSLVNERVPGVSVSNVADTVGAGDSHIGSFIALRHLGTDLIEAVRKANRVSAAVVGCPGALLDHEAFLKLGL